MLYQKVSTPGSPLRYSPCTDKPPAASASVPIGSLLPLIFHAIIFFVSSLSVHGCSDKLPDATDEEAAGQLLLGSQTGRSPAPTLPWGQWASLRYTSFAGGRGSCGFQEHGVSCE